MTSAAFVAVLARTARFEGRVPFLYRDSATTGNATCACGHLVADFNACQVIPFQPSIAQAEWDALMSSPSRRLAEFYAPLTRGRLSNASIDQILQSDLDVILEQLRAELSAFDSFPDPAAEGIADMALNLGVEGMVIEFPTFTAFIRRQDWQMAAAECHRVGISDERNAEIRALFLSA
jgi:GH24 family phage-related lysozyme (muramidase)